MSATPASVPLRVRVRNLLALHRAGRHEEALHGAVGLAELNPSALVLNLAGDLQMEAFLRNREADSDAALKHGQFAVDAYKRATTVAPNCLKTSASYIRSLSYMKLYLIAHEEVSRVEQHVQIADDPRIYHVCYDLDGDNKTKEERIKRAKDDFTAQIEIADIEQVLSEFQSVGADHAVAAAANVAKKYPNSAYAQCLHVYLQVELVGTLSPQDEKRVDAIGKAVDDMSQLARNFCNSLVISLLYAKLLIITASYTTAETECCRALSIVDPELPEASQIPLGLFSGEINSGRISSVRDEIGALRKVVSKQGSWSLMTLEQREDMISVDVGMLVEHFSNLNPSAANLITTAIEHFKSNNSWNLYICPLTQTECSVFSCDTADEFDTHILKYHYPGFFQELPGASAGEASPDMGLFNAVSLLLDSKQQDILQFRGLDEMYQCLLLLSTEKPPSIESVRLKICRQAAAPLESLTNVENNVGKKLWIEFFEACIVDYRTILLPLVSWFKLEELKRNNENVYSLDDFDWLCSKEKDQKAKTAEYFDSLVDLDWTFPDENQEEQNQTHAHSLDHGQNSQFECSSPTEKKEEALQLDIMENTTEPGKRISKKSKDKAQGSGTKHSQARMYKISGLHRPEKAKPTPPRTDNAPFDPYGIGWVHQQYLGELRRRPRHLCSFCYFEKNYTLEVNEFAHYGKEHNAWGIKCNLCPARFVSQNGMDAHKFFCHGTREGSYSQKDIKPG